MVARGATYFSGFATLPSDVEARLMADATPQYLNPGRADTVVICVHGFTRTPYEVAPTMRAISNLGLPAVSPLLPGHGYQERSDQEREFAGITKESMLAAARQEIARARKLYSRVGMFGFSMGGAISLTMAAEGLLDACAVAAPALRLSRKIEIALQTITSCPMVDGRRFGT